MDYRSYVHGAHQIHTISDLKDFIATDVRSFLAHEMAVCSIYDLKIWRTVRVINVDFPAKVLERFVQHDQGIPWCTIHKWMQNRQPIVCRTDQKNIAGGAEWLSLRKAYNIQSIACHGIVDPSNKFLIYFGFGNVDTSIGDELNKRLIELIPVLHYAFTRAITSDRNTAWPKNYSKDHNHSKHFALPVNIGNSSSLVTPRETEILSWISLGKTNDEIAQILGISQHTVNNHIKSIFKRLDVSTRAHAVSKAVSMSLI